MAKRNKKLSKSLLKLESLEQRQLLAGIVGGGTEVLTDIQHPNGNVYDQVLMTGASVTVTADAGQVTRVSFLDLNGDIVQAEFSGKGSLTVTLDSFAKDVAPEKYLQTGVVYSQGLASFTVQGSDSTTNFAVFSVGKGNAVNQALFDDAHTGGDNYATVQRVSIVADTAAPNGSTFGSIFAGNAAFTGSSGPVGISAANVQVQGTVTIGDIDTTSAGTPTLVFGEFSQFGTLKVAGGDLVNAKKINNAGYAFDVNLADGETSAGTAVEAKDTYSQLTFTNSTPPSVALNSPHTYNLTAGIDNITGGSSADTFIGNNDAGSAMTLSTFDKLDGGAGEDSLSISLSGAVNVNTPTSVTIANIESAMLTSSTSTVTANTTAWTGLTMLTTNSVGGSTVVAGASTDVIASDSTLGNGTMQVNGGDDLTITTSSLTNGNIIVGNSAAPKGVVTVTHSSSNGGGTTGTIAVTGGKTVTISETVGSAVNTTTTIGAITVTGTADTTTVSVTQPKKVTAAADKVGVTNGDVTITDVNNADAAKADTITSVTLSSFDDAAVNSSALATLNVSGTGTTLTTAGTENSGVSKSTTLALNLNGAGITGASSINSAVTTLNVAGSGADSTLASLSATGVTALNISGDKKVTITGAASLGSNPVIVSTNTAGVSIGTAISGSTQFTGGDGADSVTLSNGFTKAIDMGAGNDTVTYGGAAGNGGSAKGGAGTDTIVMSVAQANSVSGSATFNGSFSGFETLKLSDDAAMTINLGGINNVNDVVLAGSGSTVTIDNVASGATITLEGSGSGGTLNVTNAAFNPADALNIVVKGSGGTVTAANVETLNISSVSGAGSSNPASIKSLTVSDAAATSIVVTGSNGLTLTNTNATALTSFDASAVAGEDSSDTAANLAVTFTSAYTGSGTVGIKGGAGNDILSGNAKKDVISGGAGADWIYADNAGTKEVQTLTVTYASDNASETVNILGVDVTYASATDHNTTAANLKAAIAANSNLAGLVTAGVVGNVVTVTALVDGNIPDATSAGAGDSIVIATPTPGTAGAVAADSVDGGAGNDLIVSGGGVDTLTGGAGADTFFFLKGASTLSSISTISDFTWASGGQNNDKIVIGDVVAASGISTVQDNTVYGSLGAAVDAAALANSTNDGVVLFTWGNDTYMYVETTGAQSSYVAGDFLVKLTGAPVAVGATIASKGFDSV